MLKSLNARTFFKYQLKVVFLILEDLQQFEEVKSKQFFIKNLLDLTYPKRLSSPSSDLEK